MSQYFIIANLDKREYIKPTLLKLWEICANNDCRILPYLLATNNPDGTFLIRSIPKEEWEEMDEEEKEKWEVMSQVKVYDRDFLILKKKVKYFGRWCGDRIVIVGNYADKADNYDVREYPSHNEILETFKDITEEAVKEFNEFIEVEEYKIGNIKAISPDLIITSESFIEKPKIIK